MCLKVDISKTNEINEENWEEKTFFKVLSVEIKSGYAYSPYQFKRYWPGDIKSNCGEMDIDYYNRMILGNAQFNITRGIHVFSTSEHQKVSAMVEDICRAKGYKAVIVKVTGRKEHFLGSDAEGIHLAFTKVHLSEEELSNVSTS